VAATSSPSSDPRPGRDLGRPRFFVRLHHQGWSPRRLVEVWRAAEELGYDGVSLYDVPSRPALECWSALAYCLGATERLLGVSLVLANPVRHPALVARMAWDLNALSGGRVVLGLGAGGEVADLRALGLTGLDPMPARLDRLEEALLLVRRLLGGEAVTYRGRHYRVRDLAIAAPCPPPPLLVGGHGPRLLRLAAAHADVVNVGFDVAPAGWRRLRAELGRERAAGPRAGSPLVLSHNASLDVDGRGRLTMGGTAWRERLEELREAGVSWFFLVFADLPELGLMRRFAAEALPGPGRGRRGGRQPGPRGRRPGRARGRSGRMGG
jgi:alkanesulfonate monooxygenase SsuD/methylene tetrahydromethanopterin reductase-like flavin-dependent oxidoreductase (luciferase family)